MKNIAIVAEYNPLHYGHIYQINKIKSKYPNSNIVIIMSGNYVQRGEPTILDKFDRANLAIKYGCDLIIQLPTISSLQSADIFSYTAINILNKMKIIDYISFGVESHSIEEFNKSIDFQIKNQDKIYLLQKKYIDLGNSYKTSYKKAMDELNPNLEIEISRPNNTLAFQYIRAIKQLKSDIGYLPIIRKDGGYNSEIIDSHEFQSANTIRNLIKDNKDFSKYAPKEISNLLNNNIQKDIQDYYEILNYNINILEKDPTCISGFEEGMTNLLNKNLNIDLEKTIEKSHNKRYSKSRLRRFIINYLLDIDIDLVNSMKNINYIYALKFNDNGKKILKNIKENTDLSIVTNFKDSYNLNSTDKKIFDIETKSNKLYYMKDLNNVDKFYKNIPYVNYVKSPKY